MNVTDKSFDEVIHSKLPVLVDFWATWCAPCKMLGPIIDQLEEEYKGKFKVCKINVEDAPMMASQYGIMNVPTVIIFLDGEILEVISGVPSKTQLKGRLDAVLHSLS